MCCQLLDWLKELVTGAASRVEAPAATRKMEVLRRCGTKARWPVQAHFHGDGFVTDEAQMSFCFVHAGRWHRFRCMQIPGCMQSAYQQVYFRSCDHVRILFSRFVMKTRPIGNRTLGYISILWTIYEPKTQIDWDMRYLVLSLNMS